MKQVFFTSDQHFNHGNIIRFCHRPFANINEMNEALIKNHNEVVKPDDDVYHLGDFAFRDHKRYLRRLNGIHHLIKGNHEGNGWKEAGFRWCREVAMIKIGEDSVFLSHYAHRVWNRSHYGCYHVFGHSHGTLADQGRSCDVGVDKWNYTPVSFDHLKEYLKDADFGFNHRDKGER